jgi:hypothetical protein
LQACFRIEDAGLLDICSYVIVSGPFERMYLLHLQDYESVKSLFNSENEECTLLQNVGKNNPTTRSNNPEDLLPLQTCGGNFKSLFSDFKNVFLFTYFIFLINCFVNAGVIVKKEWHDKSKGSKEKL